MIVHPTRGRIPFKPYPYQVAFLKDRSARRLIVKARQIGMSQAVAIEAVHKAIHVPLSTILFVSRNQDAAENLLTYCYNVIYSLRDMPDMVQANQSEIVFGNGSRIMSLPANPNTGRSFAASDVYLDEFAFQAYADRIYQSVSPTTSHGGNMTVLSSPDGRANHFYTLWSGAEGGEWSRTTIRWNECPVYDQAWYDRTRPQYTAQQWATEYDCDFVTSGDALFDHDEIDALPTGWRGFQPPTPGRDYVTFWDLGRRRDATVGITLDVTDPGDLQVVAYQREIGLPYSRIEALIDERAERYGGFNAAESNGIGDPIIEHCRNPVYPYVTSRRSKIDMLTALKRAMEQRRLHLNIEQARIELGLYQWADEHLVQDVVMALAGAVFVSEIQPQGDLIWTEDEYVEISPY